MLSPIKRANKKRGVEVGDYPRFIKGHWPPPKPRSDRVARFWFKVRKTDGCWIWLGGYFASGYGQFCDWPRNRATTAHRMSYELVHGDIPPSMQVCHRCDNRACVNPEHLFLGTIADNVRDAQIKGRMRQGEKHPHAKLRAVDVRAILRRYRAGGISQYALALDYGVTRSTIAPIVQGRSWKRVSG